MDQRNVTISLPEDLLREARHLAVDQGLSLSRYVALVLEERVEATRSRRAAWERQRKLLEAGFELGTCGTIAWTRDEVHERGAS